ncbi:hypothetical protein ACIRP0_13920 [Streptomyces sp. NPDC101733]|uniref:hypothetical protein n=1 Tax=unclassified Streptomyces TaxID=2593676 RepID=UPI0038119BB9
MTSPTGPARPRPTHNHPAALLRGFVTSAVIGASLALVVVGFVLESVPVIVGGAVLAVVCGVLFRLAGAPARARRAAVAKRTALAGIESLRALDGEGGDIPVEFDLTVAPDDAPAYRVTITAYVNLVVLPGYRPGGVVVVEYPVDRPWRVRLVGRPTPEWTQRTAGARVDTAPPSSLVRKPPQGCAFGLALLVGLLVGAAVVVLPLRAELLAPRDTARPPSAPQPSVSSSTSTTVTSSGSGTVLLGPGRSMLDKDRLRGSIEDLTEQKGSDGADGSPDEALTVVVQDKLLSVVFAPTGMPAPRFDPRSLPYERLPALVEEARTTLGAGPVQTWQVTAERLTGPLVIRVGVTGPKGSASLEADERGTVVRRTPAAGG